MGETVETLHVGKPLLIDVRTTENPTTLVESFKNEQYRLSAIIDGDNTTFTTWDSEKSIKTTNDLMVSCGKLIYPESTMFTSGGYDTSDVRYYYRTFTGDADTYFGGSIRFNGITETVFNSMSEAKISVDGGASWLNLQEKRGGNDPLGIKTGYANNTVSFSMPGESSFNGATGFILKLGWTAAKSIQLTNITVVMGNNN